MLYHKTISKPKGLIVLQMCFNDEKRFVTLLNEAFSKREREGRRRMSVRHRETREWAQIGDSSCGFTQPLSKERNGKERKETKGRE